MTISFLAFLLALEDIITKKEDQIEKEEELTISEDLEVRSIYITKPY